MSIRLKLIRGGMAAGGWFVIWGLLSLGIAVGLEGKPNASLALRVLGYGSASALVFGALAFFGWWQGLPLWFRGGLYGLLAAAPEVLAIILLFGIRGGTLDWWWVAAAAIISGLFGYLMREILEDWVEPTVEPTNKTE